MICRSNNKSSRSNKWTRTTVHTIHLSCYNVRTSNLAKIVSFQGRVLRCSFVDPQVAPRRKTEDREKHTSGRIEQRQRPEGLAWFNEVACQRDLRAPLPGTWVRIAGNGSLREDECKDIPRESWSGAVAGQPSWQSIVGAVARRKVCEEAVVDE